ncbi:unnamed protein product (mitochondrion) [Plasmodiophora brassicae]|uniref:Ubiquitin-like domain-containing protein n=2 Tax=Plasmodiophora brassicae TaxID=37360 RepID=A0A3P3Y354_PLABS|nr:unnamed protein product [Plasmodiophora brassicae]
MQIHVKTLIGSKVQISIDEDATVLQLKQQLEAIQGIQVDQIRLIFSGKQLNDSEKLKDRKVTPGSIVHMVLQLRGGSMRLHGARLPPLFNYMQTQFLTKYMQTPDFGYHKDAYRQEQDRSSGTASP